MDRDSRKTITDEGMETGLIKKDNWFEREKVHKLLLNQICTKSVSGTGYVELYATPNRVLLFF